VYEEVEEDLPFDQAFRLAPKFLQPSKKSKNIAT